MQRNLGWFARAAYKATLHPVLATRRITYNVDRFISDNLSEVGYYTYPHRMIFLAGMAMSASTWMKNLLARIPGYYTRSTPMPFDVAYNQDICDSFFSFVPKHGYSLFKTHLNPKSENLDCIFRHGVDKVLITYRDLRDVAVARYYRLIEFPKARDAFDFVDYQALGKERALDHSIELVASEYVWWICEWIKIAKTHPERYHFTRFEDLKKDTVGEFKKVLDFYGIKLTNEKVGDIVEQARGRGTMRKNIIESRILPEGYAANFRSGRIGNWKEDFTENQKQKCKELFGPVLIELGYEKDFNW
ncbi:hypothetical protein D4S03_01980 [bacterium]|nr:MAG: hypothetical protein D4S03_01980 [bacterium]